ncbi:hypothetical protein KUTeg_007428 [Tegillarca granosa]|uniref:Cryptochrome-1 n=1 Tax=Tegillarca granosa TaxID=220873 RepID=A0ABQ9FD77_TEGGR|nr:hypothetical protein KUTeg_007428 [Tegillarca granosa]
MFSDPAREWGVTCLSFEIDPEPIWTTRDNAVRNLCLEKNVQCIESVSHTLWDPRQIIETNGGTPPLTFELFSRVTSSIGRPPKPVEDVDFSTFTMPVNDDHSDRFPIPTLEKLEAPEYPSALSFLTIIFGHLYLNALTQSIVNGISAARPGESPPISMYAQLIWREYFYTMAVNNVNYNKMIGNPICLNIPWNTDEDILKKWEMGQTGYPWIDACMNQLRQEGWIHHVGRHAVSCFLTRGDLWIDWQDGVSVRYIPALKEMPTRYIYEPWKAPRFVQENAKCIIGVDYPTRIVDHDKVSKQNAMKMKEITDALKGKEFPHCAPANEDEVKTFVWMPDHQPKGGHCDSMLLVGELQEI